MLRRLVLPPSHHFARIHFRTRGRKIPTSHIQTVGKIFITPKTSQITYRLALMSVVMRKARPRRPSIQYSKDDSSAPAVGQAAEEGPPSGPGGGGWGSSEDDSARWAAAKAAERTSAAIFFCLVFCALLWDSR